MKKFFKQTLFISTFLLVCSMMQAQSVTGKVSDSTGPLPGVNVAVQNSKIGTTTDLDGKFTLNNLPKDAVLNFTYLGYTSQKVVVKGKTTVNVVLVSSDVDLKEVVVMGYGSTKKKDITGSIAIVTSKDFEGKANTEFANALEGKISGVQISRPSGQPQAGVSIRIRGTSTITAGSEPLFIVDGVVTTSINEISPSDIESMTILKDASSAAIYGANGSNGVVLITTKRGGNHKTTVTFNTYTGVSSVAKTLNVLNASQYKSLMTEMNHPIDASLYTADSNWQNQGFRTAASKNYQFGVSGGDEKTNFYVSGTYLNQEGVVLTNSVERYTFKANIDHKISNSVKIGSSISYNKWKDVNVDEGRKIGAVLSLLTGAPVTGVYNPDGTFVLNPIIGDLENPIGLLLKNEHSFQNYRFNGNVYAEFSFLKYLKFKSMFGFEQLNSTYNSWVDPFRSREGRAFQGMASISNTQNTYWTTENTLSFSKSFDKHTFNALLGYIVSQNDNSNFSDGARGFGSGAVHTINAATTPIPGASYSSTTGRNLAFIGRLNYSYEDKYFLTANFRRDGYSGFGTLNRWGNFPSFSAGWRLSKEEFFKNVPVINDMKIRAGWGEVGNGQVGNYSHFGLVNPGAAYVIGGNVVPGTNPSSLESNNLKWETTKQTDIGIDLSLLHSRLTFTTDYYIKLTTDMLLNKTIPTSTGFANAIMNIGAMENRGFEFAVSSKNLVGEFKWNTDFNISFNKNKITSLPGGPIQLGDLNNDGRGLVAIAQEGKPLGSFYGYVSQGVDPATGMIKYKDIDGDGKLSDGDKTIIGNANPKYTVGFTNDFTYKNWSLDIFFQGVQGNQIFNATRIETEGMYNANNQSTAVLNRWTTPGQITNIPVAAYGSDQNMKISSRFIEDGSYIRLKSITLGYNLPEKLVSKLYMSKIHLYLTADNVITFTKYSGFDPEVNFYSQSGNNPLKNIAPGVDYGTYPQTKDVIFGVNLTF